MQRSAYKALRAPAVTASAALDIRGVLAFRTGATGALPGARASATDRASPDRLRREPHRDPCPMRTRILLAAPLGLTALLSVPEAHAQTICRQHPLTTSAGLFQGGLSVDGERLAARAKDASGADVVEVWARSGASWEPTGTLPNVATPASQFGAELDLEGSSLLVAAPFETTPLGHSGELVPFVESPSGWSPLPSFRTSNPIAHVFGDRFDRDGDVVVARSTTFFAIGAQSRLHVFVDAGAGHQEIQEIPDPNPAQPILFSNFGQAIAVEGPWLVAGGPTSMGGRAYVWRRTPVGYVFVQELIAPGVASPDFGSAVAISGNRIAVSDPGAEPTPGQSNFGVVHLFEPSAAPGFFTHGSTLRGPALLGVREFGRSIDFEGARLAATFSIGPLVQLVPLEAIAVFDDVGTFIQRTRFVIGTLSGPDRLVGATVRLARGELIATDRTEAVGNAQRLVGDLGRFALDGVGVVVCDGGVNSTGRRGRMRVDGCAPASALRLVATDLPPATTGIFVLGIEGPSVPVGQGSLCVGQPNRAAVTLSGTGGSAQGTFAPSAFGFGPGDVVRTQLWFRDGASSNLTEALELELVE